MIIQKLIIYTVLLLALMPHTACTKKDTPYIPADSLGKLNKWVYDSMQLYYYWNADMPAHPDYSLPTQDFFKQLLSPKDRFSSISNRSTIGPVKTAYELYGFHYTLIAHPFNAQQLAGVITCVAPGSQAGSIGLKRGIMFTEVNDQVITPQNRSAIVQALQAPTAMLQLAAFNNTRTALVDSIRVAAQTNIFTQKSVYATKIFESNGTKTGYLAYYFCLEKEDGAVLQSIQKLKLQGVTECIIDLRYNPGGSVASATKLAALLAGNFSPNSTFITYRGNRHGGTVKQSFQEAISFSGNASGKNMADLQSANLHLNRVFILTTPETASAAELLTHNLRPYNNVIQIGETTFGKDEASFTIEDNRNPRQIEWLLTPIVYKIADGMGIGDYSTGLAPDHVVIETSKLPLSPIGEPGDLPVDEALKIIYGTTAVSVMNL